jgi:hypothetical protein
MSYSIPTGHISVGPPLPKCDPLGVMNIKTIRPAMFGSYDLVI